MRLTVKNFSVSLQDGLLQWLPLMTVPALLSFRHLRQNILSCGSKMIHKKFGNKLFIFENLLWVILALNDLMLYAFFYFASFLEKVDFPKVCVREAYLFTNADEDRAGYIIQDMQKPSNTTRWPNTFREWVSVLCASV